MSGLPSCGSEWFFSFSNGEAMPCSSIDVNGLGWHARRTSGDFGRHGVCVASSSSAVSQFQLSYVGRAREGLQGVAHLNFMVLICESHGSNGLHHLEAKSALCVEHLRGLGHQWGNAIANWI